jgi:large subunit ribosomal protein L4
MAATEKSSATVYDRDGKETGTLELPASVFDAPVNEAVLHQAVRRQQANDRQGTHETKTRGEVSGGGKKPWKQKGTGRARQGSIRASHWVGGGKAMGPKPRDYEYRPPKQVRRGALRAALSLRAKEKALIILKDFVLDAPKSKQALQALTGRLKLESGLVVDEKKNAALHKSVRNLAAFDVLPPEGVNVESVLKHRLLVLTSAAAKALEGALS